MAANDRVLTGDYTTGVLSSGTRGLLDGRYVYDPTPASGFLPAGKRYDSRLSAFNLKPEHLRKTRAAIGLAQSGLGGAKILAVGDSNTLGLGPLLMQLDAAPYAYAARLRETMRGRGMKVSSDGLLFPAQGGDSRWVTTGQAGMINALFQSLDNGATGTFSPTTPCNAFELTYLNQYAGTFTVSIDGGAAITVTRSAVGGFATWRSDFLTTGTHTIKLTAPSGGSLHFTSVEAMTYATGPTGIRIGKAGVSGSTASDWLTGTYPFREIARLWDADLVTIMLGTNDAQSSTVATYKASMTSMVNGFRTDGAEVLLIAPPARAEIDLAPYWKALYEVAVELDAPLLDLRDRQGPYSVPGGYFIDKAGDTAHLSALAHDDLARAIFALLA